VRNAPLAAHQNNPLLPGLEFGQGGRVDADQIIRSIARDQQGLVSHRQLRSAQVSAAQIRRRLVRGTLEPMTPRVLRIAGAAATDAQRLLIPILHVGNDAILSHTTAAAWWGIAGFRLDPIHIAIERCHRSREDLAILHHATLIPEGSRMVLRGVPIAGPGLTIFQTAGMVSIERLARALDNAWSLRLLDGDTVLRLLEQLGKSGRNGIRSIRRLAEARGTDWIPPSSNVEHRFDEIMHAAGITTLRRQVDVGDEEWTGRVDFKDIILPLIVEVQSERYHAALSDRARDAARRHRHESQGNVVVEVWDHEIFYTPWAVVERVLAAIRRLQNAA
jgi:very-short-patch-repair endonuclease